jgi:hypothetical protein
MQRASWFPFHSIGVHSGYLGDGPNTARTELDMQLPYEGAGIRGRLPFNYIQYLISMENVAFSLPFRSTSGRYLETDCVGSRLEK